MDDTLCTDKQALLDAWKELSDAPIVTNVSSLEELSTITNKIQLCVLKVPKYVAELEYIGGLAVLELMKTFPENVKGHIALFFEGWEDEGKEVWEIPCIQKLCWGLLYGVQGIPDEKQALEVFSYLEYEKNMGPLEKGVCGQLLILSLAYAPAVWRKEGSQWLWAYDKLEYVRKMILEGKNPLDNIGGQG